MHTQNTQPFSSVRVFALRGGIISVPFSMCMLGGGWATFQIYIIYSDWSGSGILWTQISSWTWSILRVNDEMSIERYRPFYTNEGGRWMILWYESWNSFRHIAECVLRSCITCITDPNGKRCEIENVQVSSTLNVDYSKNEIKNWQNCFEFKKVYTKRLLQHISPSSLYSTEKKEKETKATKKTLRMDVLKLKSTVIYCSSPVCLQYWQVFVLVRFFFPVLLLKCNRARVEWVGSRMHNHNHTHTIHKAWNSYLSGVNEKWCDYWLPPYFGLTFRFSSRHFLVKILMEKWCAASRWVCDWTMHPTRKTKWFKTHVWWVYCIPRT